MGPDNQGVRVGEAKLPRKAAQEKQYVCQADRYED